MIVSTRGVRKVCSACRQKRKGGCGTEDALRNRGCQGLSWTPVPELPQVAQAVTQGRQFDPRIARAAFFNNKEGSASTTRRAWEPEGLFTETDEAALVALRHQVEAAKLSRSRKTKHRRHHQLPQTSAHSTPVDRDFKYMQTSLQELENEIRAHLSRSLEQMQRQAAERASLERTHAQEQAASQAVLRRILLELKAKEIREHKAARSAQPCISQPIGAYCVPQEVHQGGNEVPLQPGGHCLQGIISATSCIVADLAAKESITEVRGSALNDEVVADGAAMAMAADAPHDEIAYYSTERPPVQQQEPQHTPTTAAAAATQVEQPPNEANSLPKGASASCSSTEVTGEQAAETSASTETSGGIGIAGLRLPHRTNLKQLLDLQGMHDLQPSPSQLQLEMSSGEPTSGSHQRRYRSLAELAADPSAMVRTSTDSKHSVTPSPSTVSSDKLKPVTGLRSGRQMHLLHGWASVSHLSTDVGNYPTPETPPAAAPHNDEIAAGIGSGATPGIQPEDALDTTPGARAREHVSQSGAAAPEPKKHPSIQPTAIAVRAAYFQAEIPGWIERLNADATDDRSFYMLRLERRPPQPVQRGFPAHIFANASVPYPPPAVSSPEVAPTTTAAIDRSAGTFMTDDASLRWRYVRGLSTFKRLLKVAIPIASKRPQTWQQAISAAGMVSRVRRANIRYLGHSFGRTPGKDGPAAEIVRLRVCWRYDTIRTIRISAKRQASPEVTSSRKRSRLGTSSSQLTLSQGLSEERDIGDSRGEEAAQPQSVIVAGTRGSPRKKRRFRKNKPTARSFAKR